MQSDKKRVYYIRAALNEYLVNLTPRLNTMHVLKTYISLTYT